MLDLSAAFDTTDHSILLKRLQTTYSIQGNALDWFSFYLKDRNQVVCIGNDKSSSVTLDFEVPQGSVLGPKMYTMYTKPLGKIIENHNMSYHMYADDTQIYVTLI